MKVRELLDLIKEKLDDMSLASDGDVKITYDGPETRTDLIVHFAYDDKDGNLILSND
jgi:hypothetical protein